MRMGGISLVIGLWRDNGQMKDVSLVTAQKREGNRGRICVGIEGGGEEGEFIR
jgi:hypothetical protein